MVSLRCKMVVKSALEELNIDYSMLELGEVLLNAPLPELKRSQLQEILHAAGLELMADKKAILVERIKNVIIEMVHYADEFPEVNFSAFLSQKLNMDYHQLSEIFSKTKGITIEHFIIIHKIERVKELIMYDQLSLTEISYKLHYSSVAHLSNQFKKVTGLTPTFFKNIKGIKRNNLENL